MGCVLSRISNITDSDLQESGKLTTSQIKTAWHLMLNGNNLFVKHTWGLLADQDGHIWVCSVSRTWGLIFRPGPTFKKTCDRPIPEASYLAAGNTDGVDWIFGQLERFDLQPWLSTGRWVSVLVKSLMIFSDTGPQHQSQIHF